MAVLISAVRHYIGLSTDIKPGEEHVEDPTSSDAAFPAAGSTFFETDTGLVSFCDGSKWTLTEAATAYGPRILDKLNSLYGELSALRWGMIAAKTCKEI